MNKIEFKKQIKEIRGLLKANNILEATYKMIDLNRYNIDIDYYTQYFISRLFIYYLKYKCQYYQRCNRK